MASTIRDVAKLSGLSIGTVSKYINGKYIKEETKLAIEKAIKELKYRPNNIAKGLRNAKSFSVAILLPMLNSSFCTSMISSIEKFLNPKGYSVIVCECHNNEEMELQKTKFLINHMVDGIILIPYNLKGKQIELIKNHNIPLVLLDQVILNQETDAVVLDNVFSAYEPIKHLIDLGHKDIAMITGNPLHYTTIGRTKGYMKALEENNIRIKGEYLVSGNYSIDGGYEAILKLWSLKNRPSAVFISNYDMTIGAYHAINYLKLNIPEDISVIGFDNFPLTNVITPPLSFAKQPTDIMGYEAGKILYRRMVGDYSDFPQVKMYEASFHYKESIKNIN